MKTTANRITEWLYFPFVLAVMCGVPLLLAAFWHILYICSFLYIITYVWANKETSWIGKIFTSFFILLMIWPALYFLIEKPYWPIEVWSGVINLVNKIAVTYL